jgi:hypothetical protein
VNQSLLIEERCSGSDWDYDMCLREIGYHNSYLMGLAFNTGKVQELVEES